MSKFKQQATQEYDASYNQKVQTLKNQLAQSQQTLDQQKGGINSNYDLQVGNQNLANKRSRNNISNTALGRGLSNSSIVMSGLAEADQINNRLVGNINRERTGALNDIDAQKSLLAQNMQGTLGVMSADRLDGIATLSRQLEDRDFDKTHQTNQLALQRESMLADQKYKNLSLAQQKELAMAQLAFDREKLAQQLAMSGGSGGSGGGTEYDQAYNEYLSKYSEIMSNDNLTTAQKTSMLGNLKTEMNLFTAKYGLDYSDLGKTIDKSRTTSNGVTLNLGEGITRQTGGTTQKTTAPKQGSLKSTFMNFFNSKNRYK